MRVAYKKIFDFDKLVKTKDSWGDVYMQIRGGDFPEEMKRLKGFKIVKSYNDELLNLLKIKINYYTLYKGNIKIQEGNAYCPIEHVEFEDVDECIKKKYYDFANKKYPNAKIYISENESKVLWVDGEDPISDLKVVVVLFQIWYPFKK